jgi:uncharacterized protein (TIGR02598 family)
MGLNPVVVNGTTPKLLPLPSDLVARLKRSVVRVRGVFGWRRSCHADASAAKSGFTLVEVVIAIGLVAFVLTSILGLAAIASNETRNADLKARLAWITERVSSEYQSQRFSSVLGNLPATNYWDYSGMPVTNVADAYFVCEVSNVTPGTASTNNLALLQLSIRWPNPKLTSTNVCVISLFNYQ